MSTTTLQFSLKVNGVLTDVPPVTLADPSGTYGVRRTDTFGTVVAAGTAMTRVSTGVYTYAFTDPAYGLTYEWYGHWFDPIDNSGQYTFFVSTGAPFPSTLPLSKWAVTNAPTSSPVAYADVKQALRIDTDTEQTYVQTLIDAATDYAQDSLATSLMPQTLTAIFNAEDVELSPPVRDYPWDPLSPLGSPLGTPSFATWGTYNRAPVVKLPRGPVTSIVSVTDGGGTVITAYQLERTPTGDRLRFNGTAQYPVIVVYQAGYATAAAIPAGIRVAIMAHVGTLYANRESVAGKQMSVVPHSLEAFYRLKSRRMAGG